MIEKITQFCVLAKVAFYALRNANRIHLGEKVTFMRCKCFVNGRSEQHDTFNLVSENGREVFRNVSASKLKRSYHPKRFWCAFRFHFKFLRDNYYCIQYKSTMQPHHKVTVATVKPFRKPKFSEFLKEQLEARELTIEDFSTLVELNLIDTQRLLNDEFVIDDSLLSKLDAVFGLSNGFHGRFVLHCDWGNPTE